MITSASRRGLISDRELREIRQAHEKNEEIITIPRRPDWDPSMSKDELTVLENEAFLDWKRKLGVFQNNNSNLLLTPYERNAEFWKQLWRVVERSDVCVQVLDARNPLLFLSRDLQKYVKETDTNKINCVLLNKSDLLTESQRKHWAIYFEKIGIRAVFFSALNEMSRDDYQNIRTHQE